MVGLSKRSANEQPDNKGDGTQRQKCEKQNLRYPLCCSGDTRETKYASEQTNHKKHQCESKHDRHLLPFSEWPLAIVNPITKFFDEFHRRMSVFDQFTVQAACQRLKKAIDAEIAVKTTSKRRLHSE
jgi:hypothetical protein